MEPPSEASAGHPPRASTKADRARKPIMAIIFCMVTIFIAFTTLSASLQGLHIVATYQLDHAKLDQEALLNLTMKEQRIQQRLESLTDYNLGGRFFESHTECLARAINHANAHFLGRDYTEYPAVRNATIDWVKENCDRLYFSPSAIKSQQEPAKMTTWAFLSYRAKAVVSIFKKWLNTGQVNNAPLQNATKPISRASSDSKHLILPLNFCLEGCDTPPCKLVYSPPSNTPTSPISLQEAFVKGARKLSALQCLLLRIGQARRTVDSLCFGSLIVQLLAGITFLYIEYKRGASLLLAFAPHLNPLDEHMYKGLIFQGMIHLYFAVLEHFSYTLPVEACFALLILGLAGIASFFVPSDIVPNVALLFAALKGLVRAFSASELGVVTPDNKPAVLHISPETTLEEDLNVTIEALRRQAQNLVPVSPTEVDFPTGNAGAEDALDVVEADPMEEGDVEVWSRRTSISSGPDSDWDVVNA